MYTVKEVAELLNMTEHTVRFYTDKGLVPNLERDKNNKRLFDQESLNWLLCAKHLRQCDMSVEDIKTYVDLCLIGESTVQERYEIIRRQRDIAIAQFEEAKHRAKYIEEKADHYLNFINGEISEDLNPGVWNPKNQKPFSF